MKNLWLIRHAKSSWEIDSISDIDRPLNARGYTDAHEMARRLKKDIQHCLVVSSPAVRAISTALIFARTLGITASDILVRPGLYETGTEDYLSVIGSLSDEHNNVLVFGHNPIITDTANLLAGTTIEEIPTAGMIGVVFEENRWKKASAAGGKLALYDFPKNKSGG